MTTPTLEPDVAEPPVPDEIADDDDERKRRWLLLILLLLLLVCCGVAFLIARYLAKPQPLPQLLPQAVGKINYPPTYKFMITGLDKPVGVAVSPDNQRIYAAEAGGQRLIKMFDRSGNLIKAFAPAGTDPANREPKYIAVDSLGRVFMVDSTSNAIDIFDRDGKFLDAIIAQDMTLTKFLEKNIPGGLPDKTIITHFEGINRILTYQVGAQALANLKIPPPTKQWGPLGIRFDNAGDLFYTDITADHHGVFIIPAASLGASLKDFNPVIKSFGTSGSGNGQFNFPQTVVNDSKGNFYVSDGNNTRIVEWTTALQYKTFFGIGANEQSLNLPRGLWVDAQDRLHVADAVGSVIRVYDISGPEPAFLYNFGEDGAAEGQFSFPIDICEDGTGRLYIADRENNRVDIWSY